MLPDRPFLVSMSGRKVEFSGFPYFTQLYEPREPAPFPIYMEYPMSPSWPLPTSVRIEIVSI